MWCRAGWSGGSLARVLCVAAGCADGAERLRLGHCAGWTLAVGCWAERCCWAGGAPPPPPSLRRPVDDGRWKRTMGRSGMEGRPRRSVLRSGGNPAATKAQMRGTHNAARRTPGRLTTNARGEARPTRWTRTQRNTTQARNQEITRAAAENRAAGTPDRKGGDNITKIFFFFSPL